MKYIFEHMTMIGMQDHTGQWWKVVEHCARCGKCCMDIGANWLYPDGKGGCVHLELEEDNETYRCDLRVYRPQGCSTNDPFTRPDFCSHRMEKIDDPSSLL